MNYKKEQNKLTNKLRNLFRKRRRQHDPMLVFSISIFNFEGGWNRIFNPVTQRENVW